MSNYNNTTNNSPNASLSQNAIPVVGASGVLSSVGPLTNGQVLVGKSGNIPTATTLSAGANISFTNAAGSITVNATGSTGTTWNVVTGTTQSTAASNGYISTNASMADMSLPASSTLGDEIKFSNKGGGFNIVPNTGQTINFLTSIITAPNGLKSSGPYAAIDLVASVDNKNWNVINHEGTVTQSYTAIGSTLGAFTGFFLRTRDGSAWGMGTNSLGELGDLTTTDRSSPVSVKGGFSFHNISSGDYFCGALDGSNHCWCWGFNLAGQLGNQTRTGTSSPVSVVGAHDFYSLAFSYNSMALKADGTVWGWGDNSSGQIGNNTRTSYSSPVSTVGNHSFIQIAALYSKSSLGLKADGTVWAWGDNTYGQLGNRTVTSYSSPISVVGAHSFVQISAGTAACYGLKADGTLWAWGDNSSGELGTYVNNNNYSSPVSVVGNHSFKTVAGAYYCAFALKADGSIWSWGSNAGGQLGLLDNFNRSSPVSVVGNYAFNSLPISGNAASFMFASSSDGGLWGWGDNTYGQLGNNTTTSYSSPIYILSTL